MKRKKIALFRFGVIAPLIGVKKTGKGAKQKLLNEITQKQWEIPYSHRTYISRSTVKEWLRRYETSGNELSSLEPYSRSDSGYCRTLDPDTELAVINFKRRYPNASAKTVLKICIRSNIIPPDIKVSPATIYRIFKKHRIGEENKVKKDLKKFEADLPNDLWQTDCMHGPLVDVEGKQRKSFLFAIIDDHSRLISHAQFYLRENLDNFLDCLETALCKRGVPRKIYTDNGPCFRSYHLEHVTASLGIALIHTKPYSPESKGKIERWFRTLRMQFIPSLPSHFDLNTLNKKLWKWIECEYHERKHRSTGQKPFDRYSKKLELIRKTPDNIRDFFRCVTKRKVTKDRAVFLNGHIFEAPVELIGEYITLLFHKNEPLKIEAFWQSRSYGLLTQLDQNINSRIIRKSSKALFIENDVTDERSESQNLKGELFDERRDNEL